MLFKSLPFNYISDIMNFNCPEYMYYFNVFSVDGLRQWLFLQKGFDLKYFTGYLLKNIS